jgi:hypothetical protein
MPRLDFEENIQLAVGVRCESDSGWIGEVVELAGVSAYCYDARGSNTQTNALGFSAIAETASSTRSRA